MSASIVLTSGSGVATCKGFCYRSGVTEFDESRQLVADFLYVVYFIDGKDPTLCIIPRDAIKPEFVASKQGFRISGRFKNESTLKPFLHTI